MQGINIDNLSIEEKEHIIIKLMELLKGDREIVEFNMGFEIYDKLIEQILIQKI